LNDPTKPINPKPHKDLHPQVLTIAHHGWADADAVGAQFVRVVDTLAVKYPDATAHLDAAQEELLAFTGYPHEISSLTPGAGHVVRLRG
jgi:transposase-like protein